MSEWYLRVKETLVEVTEEIYYEYTRMKDEERNLVEQDKENKNFLYSYLDFEDFIGEELLRYHEQKSVEEQIETKYAEEYLIHALNELDEMDRNIIIEIYFNENSIPIIAKEMNLSGSSICKRHDRVLKTLKDKLCEKIL